MVVTLLIVVGLCLVVVGSFMVSPGLAVVVVGVGLLRLAIMMGGKP